jgi:antibiotic biosynthesis monooxygenase (ABM) superfamily enzyme
MGHTDLDHHFPADHARGHSLGPLLEGLSVVPRLAITTAVTVPIMTWLVMPRVTRLRRGWQYPGS